MRVQPPSIRVDDRSARLCAVVESDTQVFDPFEISIGVPRQYVGWLDPSGNAFLPTLLLLAGSIGEPLLIEAPVSPCLLEGAAIAETFYRDWWQVAQASINAESQSPLLGPSPECRALFFTRGVDSWFSALRAQQGTLSHKITHLLYAADFDHQYSPATRTQALLDTQEAATCLGIPLIPVSHNGRQLLDRFVNWERSHGAVLAGIGLALGRGLSRTVIASSYNQQQLIPWGSHPQLDPLWSTEKNRVRLDGVEYTRTEKVAAISQSRLALSRLKVCWQTDTKANCGQCEKCIRTQLAICLAGVSIPQGVFENALKLESISGLGLATAKASRRVFWEELFEHTADKAEFHSWHDAIRQELQPDCEERPVVWVPAQAATELLPRSIGKLLPSMPTACESDFAGKAAIEITWGVPSQGRTPLPLRPTATEALNLLRTFRTIAARPVSWCMVERATPDNARLLHWLHDTWGPGLAALDEVDSAAGDHGTPFDVAESIQRRSQIRCWYGDTAYLDPFRLLATLTLGCLPQMFVPLGIYEELCGILPRGMDAFLQPINMREPTPPLDLSEVETRLDRGLSVLLQGNFERDLYQALTFARAA